MIGGCLRRRVDDRQGAAAVPKSPRRKIPTILSPASGTTGVDWDGRTHGASGSVRSGMERPRRPVPVTTYSQGGFMINEKMQLSCADLDGQVAFELPERETLALVTVVITNLLNQNSVDISVRNNSIAVQICAAVSAINTLGGISLSCQIRQ